MMLARITGKATRVDRRSGESKNATTGETRAWESFTVKVLVLDESVSEVTFWDAPSVTRGEEVDWAVNVEAKNNRLNCTFDSPWAVAAKVGK